MAFKNRIRLPFYVTRPQYPTEQNVFRLANGRTKTASVVIRKTFEGETENLPKEIHERLVIALRHDDVTIEGYRYLGGVSLDGDYEIDWQKFLDYPLAKAEFKVQVTPFNYSNDNCQTCEEISQVVCVDDDLGTIGEDETHTVHVLANDSICCKPVTISLVTYNTDFLDSCVISDNDIIIHTKPSLITQNNVVLATYRAQCPDGSYDEANIIANIDGTDPTPVCLTPTNVVIDEITDTTVTFHWTAPSPAPDCGYHWEVKHNIVTAASGDVAGTTATATGLTPNTSYTLSVRSNCCDDFNSSYAPGGFFTTDPPDETQTCGLYILTNNSIGFASVSYIDCNGNQQNVFIGTGQSSAICALQYGPGDPVEIIDQNGNTDISYTDLC